MKAAIEAARQRRSHTSALADEARTAQQRYDEYASETDNAEMTSPARLRELRRECEVSEARLRHAWAAGPQPSADSEGDDETSGPDDAADEAEGS